MKIPAQAVCDCIVKSLRWTVCDEILTISFFSLVVPLMMVVVGFSPLI